MNSPVNLYEMFGAESLQHDSDQTTADGWSVIYAIGFACFGAGALTTAAVAWVISWFL